jgi:hypothetical protein
MTPNAAGTDLAVDANGMYIERPATMTWSESYFKVPAGGTNQDQKMIQQKGQMFYSRPIYGVIGNTNYYNALYWYTSLVSSSPFLQPSQTTNSATTGVNAARSMDLYNYPS